MKSKAKVDQLQSENKILLRNLLYLVLTLTQDGQGKETPMNIIKNIPTFLNLD